MLPKAGARASFHPPPAHDCLPGVEWPLMRGIFILAALASATALAQPAMNSGFENGLNGWTGRVQTGANTAPMEQGRAWDGTFALHARYSGAPTFPDAYVY